MKSIRTLFYQSFIFIRQPIFILSVIAYVFLFFYRSFEDLSSSFEDTPVYYFLVSLYNYGGLPLLLLTLNALPILSFVCDEWNSGAILYHLNRESLWRYIIVTLGKVLLLSWLIYSIATGMLIIIFAMFAPFFPATNALYFKSYVSGYGVTTWLLKEGHSVLYYIAVLVLQWWQRAIFYLVTTCLTLYMTNRYVIVTIPSILWTLCNVINGWYPSIMNPINLFSERLEFLSMEEVYRHYVFASVWSVCLVILCILWFGYGLQYKIQSGRSFGKVNQVW